VIPDPEDTIVALSSPPGAGLRGIVRLSGSRAFAMARSVFEAHDPESAGKNFILRGSLRVGDVMGRLPADLHVWRAPRSYTGQDLVEIHTLSSPPLLELLIAQLLGAGARAAQPGEFTLRAFLAGKLDLTRAEAVLGAIEARDRDELSRALAQLAGGMSRPLQSLRDDLLNLLADLEAGLDFSDEDIEFIAHEQMLNRLGNALRQLNSLLTRLTERALADRPFRVVLAGRPNAGKSSLFNALTARGAGQPASPRALVAAEAGTTRDYLVGRFEHQGTVVELVDTAGWQEATAEIEGQAQVLGRAVAKQCDVLLLCLEAGLEPYQEEEELLARNMQPRVLPVTTKCDLGPAPGERVATSILTGEGIANLRNTLAELAHGAQRDPMAPSLSRCRANAEICLGHLTSAESLVAGKEPQELIALEIRCALDQLDEMLGIAYSDDLLDRIFSRFCIGK
jgi:tRNA modification GTPase